jgi:hypothetical protein
MSEIQEPQNLVLDEHKVKQNEEIMKARKIRINGIREMLFKR